MNDDLDIMLEDLGKAWLPKISFKKKTPAKTVSKTPAVPKVPTVPGSKPVPAFMKPMVEMLKAKLPPPPPKPMTPAQETARDVAGITPEVVALEKQGYRLVSTTSEMNAQMEYGKNAEKIREKYDDVKMVRISDKPTKSGFVVAIMVKDKPVEVAIVNKPDGTTETIVKPNPLKAMQLKFMAMPKNKQIMVGAGVAIGIGAVILIAVKAKGGKNAQQ